MKDVCLTKATDDESRAFYLKMIGDYYRYMAESVTGEVLNQVAEKALEFYTKAQTEAEKLPVYNSIRLGLALNFSVFHYEVKNNSTKACEIAQRALDAAKEDIDNIDNESAKDALSIVELLRENLDLWKEAEENEKGGEVEDL